MTTDSALSVMLEIKKVSVSHLNFLKQANASLLLNYKTFFTNTDTVNCPVDKCDVLMRGCKKPFGVDSVKYF
jgi:hypothetical protein